MPLQAIETQRLYQQVAAQIAEMIRSGEWAMGARLPPERDIARLLGVSRPTVREAMLALELAGLIEVRSGAGTYVRPSASGGIGLIFQHHADAGPSPFEILSARRVVEGELAAIAATRISAPEIAALEFAIDRMEGEAARGTHTCIGDDNGDFLFHTRLAAVAGNQVLESIIRNLWENMRSPLYRTFSERMKLAGMGAIGAAQHRAILERIVDGDADGARTAMHDHLDQTAKFLLRDD